MEIYKKHLLRIIYCETAKEVHALDHAISHMPSNLLRIVQCGDTVPLGLAGQLHQEWECLLAGEREVDMTAMTIGLLGSIENGRVPYRIDPKKQHGDPGSGLQPIKKDPSAGVDQESWPEIVERKLGRCSCGCGGSENSSTNVRSATTPAKARRLKKPKRKPMRALARHALFGHLHSLR